MSAIPPTGAKCPLNPHWHNILCRQALGHKMLIWGRLGTISCGQAERSPPYLVGCQAPWPWRSNNLVFWAGRARLDAAAVAPLGALEGSCSGPSPPPHDTTAHGPLQRLSGGVPIWSRAIPPCAQAVPCGAKKFHPPIIFRLHPASDRLYSNHRTAGWSRPAPPKESNP